MQLFNCKTVWLCNYVIVVWCNYVMFAFVSLYYCVLFYYCVKNRCLAGITQHRGSSRRLFFALFFLQPDIHRWWPIVVTRSLLSPPSPHLGRFSSGNPSARRLNPRILLRSLFCPPTLLAPVPSPTFFAFTRKSTATIYLGTRVAIKKTERFSTSTKSARTLRSTKKSGA